MGQAERRRRRSIISVARFSSKMSRIMICTLDKDSSPLRDRTKYAIKVRYYSTTSTTNSAGLRTGQTGQLPRGLHKKGLHKSHFFNMAVSYSVEASPTTMHQP